MAEALNDILSNATPPAPEPAPEPAATPESVAPQQTAPRDATGKFAPKEPATPETPESTPEPAKAAPKVDFSEKERALLAAATEERRKRQELERRLAEISKPPQEPEKPFWDDPEAALKRQTQHLEQSKAQIAQMFIQERIKISEHHARKQYEDFDDKVNEFGQALQEVPGLYQQWLSSPDPAEFAYKTAKNRIELREVGSLEQYKAKIEKEARIKVEAEFKKKMEDLEKQRQSIPDSLSSVTGATGQTSKPVWGGPTPLRDILAR